MEFLFELLFQFLGELLLQIISEALVEFGFQSIAAPFRRKPNPWLAAFGHILLGAGAGALSLWAFPVLFIASPLARLANLALTPILAGSVMMYIGEWRRRRDQKVLRVHRFAYGYLFALAMALVRFCFGR